MMNDNVNCAMCNKVINPQFDESVKCNGSCFKKFHAKCLKLTTAFLKQFRECKNLIVNCDECAASPIMSLNETVKKMLSYLQIIDERIKRHDEEFKIVNEEFITISEIYNEKSEGIKAEINKVAVNINGGRRADRTKKSNPVVVVQPKKSQTNQTTKSELSTKIDPKSIGISDIHNISKGGIAIRCNTSDETNKFKDEAVKKMGENYTIKISEMRRVKVKLFGMSDKMSDNELKETIEAQNQFMKNSEIKIITIFENKKHNNFGAILEIDIECYNQILRGEKIKIGWCRCKVVECIDVRRCFKCCGYNHTSSQCRNRMACLKCGGEHLMKDCGAKNCVCVNCKVAVEKLNVKLDIFHPAYSFQCPVYQRKLHNEKKRIKVNI